MAIAIAKAGGIGVIHRNLDIKKQIEEIKKVKKLKLLVGAAVGAGPLELKKSRGNFKRKDRFNCSGYGTCDTVKKLQK